MSSSTIALVFDFDDTLAPDSTSSFLDHIGLDVPKFWERHQRLLREGWDPVPAYLQMMIEESRGRHPGDQITKDRLVAWGRSIKCYAGAGQIFERLQKEAARLGSGIRLECFMVSSGIGTTLRATRIARNFHTIWASDFSFDEQGRIAGLKNVVSFTDKTRFIFQIAKGLIGEKARSDPFAVNGKVEPSAMHVPLSQMVVVGDGFTDVPCFSLVQKSGGIAIGVYDRTSRERWGKAWGFIEDQRVTHLVAADYRKHSGLDDALCMAIQQIGKKIKLRQVTYQG